MQQHIQPAAARAEYLARLTSAVDNLPHGLASDLTAEIAAELNSLEGEALTRHIAALGTPEAVAQAALEAAHLAPPADPFGAQAAPPAAASPRPLSETRGYAIVGLILLGIGALVIPGVGWVIGAVLVATSKLWSGSEKLRAILAVPAALVLCGLLGWVVSVFLKLGGPGGTAAAMNPLVPGAFDVVTATVAAAVLIAAPLSALWLLLRLRNRTGPEDIPMA